VTVQILDGTGEVIREITGPDRQGYNRIAWDLRKRVEPEATGNQESPRRRGPPREDVEPGTYTVKLVARGMELVQTVSLVPDKRLQGR
jgi:hypothetical protein